MWFASAQKLALAPKLNLFIGNQKLEDVQCYKYLGVYIDSELTLAKFVKEINCKLINKIFKLAKLRYMVDEKTAIAIYRQTILTICGLLLFKVA